MHPPAGGASCHPQHFLFWPAAPEPETREGTRAHCLAAPGPLATYSLTGNVQTHQALSWTLGAYWGRGSIHRSRSLTWCLPLSIAVKSELAPSLTLRTTAGV